jgi:hypothetical protein
MTRKRILFIGLTFGMLMACSTNPLDIDTSEVDLSIHFIDLDSIFVHVDTNSMAKKIANTPLKPNEILDYELGYCLKVGRLNEMGTIGRLKLFVNDRYFKRVEKRIEEKFQDKNKYKKTILEGFKRLKFHLPNANFPQNIVFLNSQFSSNAFCSEHEIGIGLERYLGKNTDVIQELPDPIFQWIKDGMDAQYLERDAFTAWIMTHLVSEVQGNTAEQMIRWGKILYLTEAAMPDAPKAKIMRYSEQDFQWAVQNEASFWEFLVKQKMLFSLNERDQANLLNEGPFTVGLPQKGPDRLGQFLGWQMIHAYMAENPDTKLEDLVNLPYTEILQAYEIE